MTALPTLSKSDVCDLDADAITGLTTGDPCGLLPDTRGGRGAAQSTVSRQPIYTSSDADANGHSSLTADGVDDYLDQTVAISPLLARKTVVFIGKVISTDAPRHWVDGTTTTTETRLYYSTNSAAAGKTSSWDGTTRVDAGARLTTPQIFIATQGPTSTHYAVQNGGIKGTGTSDSTAEFYSMLRIGASGGLAAYTAMKVFRVVVYDGYLTNADVVTLDTWAQDNYGIAVADYAGSGGGPTPNSAPTAPTAFTEPAAAASVTGTALVSHGGSTDPDNDPITYAFELTTNGTTWISKATGLDTPYLNYDYSVETPTATAKWRSRASDGALTSAWTESGVFTIATPPVEPELAVNVRVLGGAWQSATINYLGATEEPRLTALSGMSGPYHSTVPTSPVIDSNSAAKIANLAAVPGQTGNHHYAGLSWATVHFAVPSDPDRTVVYRDESAIHGDFAGPAYPAFRPASTPNVPLSSYPQPGGLVDGAGWDGWLAVVDGSTMRAWWRAVDDGSTITATTGHHCTYPGDYQVTAGLGRGDGLWVGAGSITAQEVAACLANTTDTYVFPHALALALPGNILDNQFRYPAVKTDGQQAPASGLISQGSRLWMPRNVAQVAPNDGTPRHKLARAWHRTLQEYGGYVVDRTTADGASGPVMMNYERHNPADTAAMVWPEGISGQTAGSTGPISDRRTIAKAYYDAGMTFDFYSLDGNTWDTTARIQWASMQVLASWNGT